MSKYIRPQTMLSLLGKVENDCLIEEERTALQDLRNLVLERKDKISGIYLELEIINSYDSALIYDAEEDIRCCLETLPADIDGTLVEHQGEPSEEFIKAINDNIDWEDFSDTLMEKGHTMICEAILETLNKFKNSKNLKT